MFTLRNHNGIRWKDALDLAQREIAGRNVTLAMPTLSLTKAISSEKFFYTPSIYREQQMQIYPLKSSDLEDKNKAKPNFADILGVKDLSFIGRNIQKLIQCQHPMLSTVSSYYFNAEGKKLRPLLVLLISKIHALENKEQSLEHSILDSQKSLAFITEMIHTASLLHDDVIDEAISRRGSPSVNVTFGNKLSILAGDYLLSRASVALARLGSLQVVELLAEVIGELVEGEVMQLNGVTHELSDTKTFIESSIADIADMEPWQITAFESYLRKTYMKTASLMAKSCQAAILLRSESDLRLSRAAFEFGKNVGIAFQLIDDCLDFTVSSEELGKPADGSDLRLGLSTAPVLFASMEFPELKQFILTPQSSTAEAALGMVKQSRGVEKTKEMAKYFTQTALHALHEFHKSPSRDALEAVTNSIVHRTK